MEHEQLEPGEDRPVEPIEEPVVDVEAVEQATDDPPPPPRDPRLNLRRIDVVILIVITVLSGFVHFARLATPDKILPASDEQCKKFPRIHAPCRDQIPLDEWHYLPDARDVILYGNESDLRVPPDDGAFVVHPPVGKWFIALGIRIFGDAGFGWRFSSALLGSLASALMYLLAFRLWRSTLLAGIAALLLSVEGLWFVMSRVAMLDISMAFFVLLGVWLLIEDKYRTATWHRGARPWRIGAGLAFGFALASKWGAIPFIAVAFALAFSWEMRAGFDATYSFPPEGSADRIRPRIGARIVTLTGSLVLIPTAIYIATYVPWFVDSHRYNPPRCVAMDASWLSPKTVPRLLTGWVSNTGRVGQWICYQREILDFHLHLEKYESSPKTAPAAPQPVDGRTSDAGTVARKPAHPYFGDAWTWPWAGRPVAHFYETTTRAGEEHIEHILGLPNVAIWWPAFFLGIPLLAWRALRKRDPTATFIIAFVVAGWLPYLYADAKQRPVFLFYALPLVPFLILGVVHLIARATARYPGFVIVAGMYTAVAVLTFAYFYPVIAAYPVAREGWFGWSRRMWLYSPHIKVFGRYLIPGDCTAVDVIKHFCWI